MQNNKGFIIVNNH